MRSKRLVAISVISGLVCAIAVFAFTQSVAAQADNARAEAMERYGGEQLEVCVATTDIAAGETISGANVTQKMWLADLLPSDAIESLDEIKGMQVGVPVSKGEVLCKARFGTSASGIDVPEGMSALSVPAGQIEAVGGAVGAGSRVDVYLVGGNSTSLLSANTVVLATSAGESANSSGDKITWITLAVKPEKVEEFVSAAERGSLYFVLPGKEKEKTS